MPNVSERSEMRNNERFGRFDLVDHNHFTFSRRSGLPREYFEDDLAPAKGILFALALSLAGMGVLAMAYAVFV
ncbi:MAG: hypothetical protein MUO77_10370 [Anaerolineales bacterium]|nr:hypothetical protein [Anaerolineales bacterium]